MPFNELPPVPEDCQGGLSCNREAAAHRWEQWKFEKLDVLWSRLNLLMDVHQEDGHTSFGTCSLDQGVPEMEQNWRQEFQR